MTSPLTESFLGYRQMERPAPSQALRAGPLTMDFEPATGFLRRIRFGEVEVLRGIYAAVRDHNWGTVPAELSLTMRRITPTAFHLEFECTHRRAEIDFAWRGVIDGQEDGTLRYEFDGEARSDFRRNRIGFCVLHPIKECAGALARQFRTDGSERDVAFPSLIEPQIFGQGSFQQLRGVRHEVAPGCSAQVDFEGDVFETEDQRNWTDASFKTYCTPLLEPFPVAVKAGQRIRQVVTLRLMGAGGAKASHRPATGKPEIPVLVVPREPTGMLPHLGLGVASHGETLTENEIARLRELQLAHLRVDVRFADADAIERLDGAWREASQLNIPLELAVHLPASGDGNLGGLRTELQRRRCRLARVLALRDRELATTAETLRAVRQHLGDLGAPVGAGSDCNFRELNYEHAQGRLGLADTDLVFWSANPQVHAYDHRSVMETIEAQPATVQTARAFAGKRSLVLSPITLRQRFNPVATGADISPAPGELPATVDARQSSQFAAAWTLGSIAALASAGVESATYFETTGWRGVMERTEGSLLPDKFPSAPGEIFPVFRVLAGLVGFREAAVVLTGELVAVTLFREGKRRWLLLGNLTGEARKLRIEGWARPRQQVLAPYAVARFEVRS